MPLCLEVPVLSVDANAIHRVNTYDPENLFVLWTSKSHLRGNAALRLDDSGG